MDRELVDAARHGDQEAFVDLMRPRSDRLFAIAYRIIRDQHGAEDALQDALMTAWRDVRRLRDPERFDAWFQRLLVNVCIRHASRERRRVATLMVLPTDGPAARDELLSIGDRDELERAFLRLPPQQRAILVLRHYLGYEPTEIADNLGIPAGTARSRLHNAQRAMREALDEDARSGLMEGRPA